jgi:hypothetical protein
VWHVSNFLSLAALCCSWLACIVDFRALDVHRNSRACAHLAFLYFVARAVRGNVECVVGGSFSVRMPQPSGHCRAFKAAVSFWFTTAWGSAV